MIVQIHEVNNLLIQSCYFSENDDYRGPIAVGDILILLSHRSSSFGVPKYSALHNRLGLVNMFVSNKTFDVLT